MVLLYVLLSVFPLAFLAPLIVRGESSRGAALAVLPGLLFILLAEQIPVIAQGQPVHIRLDWLPSLNLSFGLYIDGLSLLFGLIITLFGALIIIYASFYFHGARRSDRFFLLILLFMASMVGVVLAENLFTMFIFWELTSLTSFLLIGYNHEDEGSRWSALQALLITGGGGLALLVGLILISSVTGTYGLVELFNQHDVIQSHPLYASIVVLVCAGAFTKSAQFPFHFWLPGAMSAPTPVSAYLHSATMVKAGVYLLARLSPVLGGTELWMETLTIAGGLTMTIASILALPQTDLKKLLAYTTISALGLMVLLIGMGTKTALTAAVLFLLVHSLYKGTLFMVAGAIDHTVHTRDARCLRGLRALSPVLVVAAVLAALSMSGLPPFLGFTAKEIIYDAQYNFPVWGGVILAASMFANAVNVKVAIYTGIYPFFGTLPERFHSLRRDTSFIWVSPMVVAVLGMILFFVAGFLEHTLITPSLSALWGRPLEAVLHVEEGMETILMFSGLTLLLGLLLFWKRGLFQAFSEKMAAYGMFTLTAMFKNGFYGLLGLFGKVTRTIQHGSLNWYLVVIFSMVSFSMAIPLIYMQKVSVEISFDDFSYLQTGIALLIIAGAFLALYAKIQLFAVVSLGVVGAGVALMYTLNAAPDVAITQLVVETLTVVLFVLVLYQFPRRLEIARHANRFRDALLSIVVGILMAALTLFAYHDSSLNKISEYFIQSSYPEAHGRNIVNVILVDFRGIDTMGEITVLGIAALGIFALLKLSITEKKEEDR